MNGKAVAPPVPPGPSRPVLKPRGARLLALDGGGVKGISSILILNAIMNRVRTIEQQNGTKPSNEPRKPVDYFDPAGGTSTGGLLALMLFRLRMDTTQCIEVYRTLASTIFAATFLGSRTLGDILGKVALMVNALWNGSQFSGALLEHVIKQVVDRHSVPNDHWKYTGLVQFDMADYKRMPELELLTGRHLAQADAITEVDQIAQLLASTQ